MRYSVPLQASAISGEMTGFFQSRGGKGLERQTERKQPLLKDVSTYTCVPIPSRYTILPIHTGFSLLIAHMIYNENVTCSCVMAYIQQCEVAKFWMSPTFLIENYCVA